MTYTSLVINIEIYASHVAQKNQKLVFVDNSRNFPLKQGLSKTEGDRKHSLMLLQFHDIEFFWENIKKWQNVKVLLIF